MRKGKLAFSQGQNIETVEFSRCLSFGTKSYFCLFVFSECATFPETMLLLCSICAVFTGLWSIMNYSTDIAIIISVLLWNSTSLIILVLFFVFYFIIYVFSDCFRDFTSYSESYHILSMI